MTRRRWTYLAIAVAAIAILAVAVPYVYINYIDDEPAPLALETQTPDGSESPSEPGDEPEVAADGTWTVADGSEAGYRVDEVLNGQDNTVVGRTSNVTGEVTVTDGSLTAGSVEVDMTTVTTDSGARDGQFNDSIMSTAEFPTSAFAFTPPVDLGALSDEGGPVTVTAAGELTIRDVTHPVEVELSVQLTGNGTAQVAGSIPVTFADFGVDAPNLGFVKVEDAGLVEFLLNLEQS